MLLVITLSVVHSAVWPAVEPEAQQPAVVATSSARSTVLQQDSVEELERLVTRLLREHMPHKYEKKKNWGNTTKVMRGLSVSRDGLRIETRRRWKDVNHGTWTMYRIEMVDVRDELKLELENVKQVADRHVRCDMVVAAKLNVFGRLSQWHRGVQLVSLSADAEAKVRLRVRTHTDFRMDITRFPPDLVVDPVVKDAELQLVQFRLKRLSQLGGPLAKHLGSNLREVLEDELEDKRHSLAQKLNRQIDKNRDKLRLSLHDLIASKWGEFVSQLKLQQGEITAAEKAEEEL